MPPCTFLRWWLDGASATYQRAGVHKASHAALHGTLLGFLSLPLFQQSSSLFELLFMVILSDSLGGEREAGVRVSLCSAMLLCQTFRTRCAASFLAWCVFCARTRASMMVVGDHCLKKSCIGTALARPVD